jgi:hypothetical protein
MPITTEAEITALERRLAIAKNAADRAKSQVEKAQTDLDAALARLPKPLELTSTWSPYRSEPSSLIFKQNFDDAGDLCLTVFDVVDTGRVTTADCWIDRDGAKKIIEHLQRALDAHQPEF